MKGQQQYQQILAGAFEEAALALGGVVATYPIPDEATWALARALDEIHERASMRYEDTVGTEASEDDPDVHLAVVHLLRQIRTVRQPAAAEDRTQGRAT